MKAIRLKGTNSLAHKWRKGILENIKDNETKGNKDYDILELNHTVRKDSPGLCLVDDAFRILERYFRISGYRVFLYVDSYCPMDYLYTLKIYMQEQNGNENKKVSSPADGPQGGSRTA